MQGRATVACGLLGLRSGGGDFGPAIGQRPRRQVGAAKNKIEAKAGRHHKAGERQRNAPVEVGSG